MLYVSDDRARAGRVQVLHLERVHNGSGVATPIMTGELNYCQDESHYNYYEDEKKFLHRSDTQETKECLEEQFKLRKIGRYGVPVDLASGGDDDHKM